MKLPALSIKVLTTKETKALREKLQQATGSLQSWFIDYAPDIKRVQHFKYWQDWGFKSFDDYCQTELGITKSWGYRVALLGHLLLADKLTAEKVKEIGIKPAIAPYQEQQLKTKFVNPGLQNKDKETIDLDPVTSSKEPSGLRNYLKNHPEETEKPMEIIEPDFSSLPAIIFPPDRYRDYQHSVQVREVASRFAGVHWRVSPWRVEKVLDDVFWEKYCNGEFEEPVKEGEEWKKAALDRDGWACGRCSRYWPLQVHHIKRRSAGGTNALDNLQTLCLACHMKEHGQ